MGFSGEVDAFAAISRMTQAGEGFLLMRESSDKKPSQVSRFNPPFPLFYPLSAQTVAPG